MLDEKWTQILEGIKTAFEVEEEYDGQVENIPGATFEGIVFFMPDGKHKLVRTKRPKVLNKKTQFSNRIGSDVQVDYEYSEDEFVDDMGFFIWNELEQDWREKEFNF
ncbi:hypothetical protein COT97_01700 [Candidatus Falkowbacteria bacterium CG10_big_fil_rev_8_21_14_0_10_39_11]|uniref:Uncharacterized protein n=1 Tax=Candidatus Falkowbacteria bacterium CG10_big_fil_rev_8_21_14_0_10_39_11 TaxID=1974565 RepID=A0A2H0V5P1_9BACT|nr:MAG: hypothetical protein COT97_01700 [Candidatus Falkowbacteria bacterium CG10_big_fil_rev_8_21_14_0_10_39_11]